MKSWITVFLVLLTLQGVAQAAPRDDFFTSLNSDTAYSRSVDDFTYKTQALRLLGIISSSTPPSNASTNIAQINAVTPLMGNGPSGTGAQRVTLASDSTGILASVGSITTAITPGTAAANLGKAEDAAAVSGDTGVAVFAVRTDAPVSGANASATGDYVPLSTDSFGRTWTASVLTPTIDQGLSQHRLISAATTNATVVKASQGNIYNIQAFNNGVAAAYLKFYNIATSPTVGTTTTVKVLMLPPGGGLTVDSSAGIQFATGISYSIVTNLVDTDATAIAINQVAVNIDFR